MSRSVALLALPLVLFPLLLNLAPASGADSQRLVATVGPDFTIDLADGEGRHVDSARAGTYELLVRDLSDIHNFVLAHKNGAGFRVDSGVEFVGDRTFTIELVPGQYGYACSPHWQDMNGSLTVVPSATPAPAPPSPKRTLKAAIGAAGSPSLSARSIAAGDYSLLVRDRSRTRNFHLVGPGLNRRTSKPFVGTVTWQVTLERGTYRFGSDPRLSGRLVVG